MLEWFHLEKLLVMEAFVLLALCFLSGAAWGLHEKTMHHWAAFAARFPSANPRFWNPAISWQNKYVSWPEDQRHRRLPVFFTDAKHLLASLTQITGFVAGMFLVLSAGSTIWCWVVWAGLCWGVYSVGNFLTFNLLYR